MRRTPSSRTSNASRVGGSVVPMRSRRTRSRSQRIPTSCSSASFARFVYTRKSRIRSASQQEGFSMHRPAHTPTRSTPKSASSVRPESFRSMLEGPSANHAPVEPSPRVRSNATAQSAYRGSMRRRLGPPLVRGVTMVSSTPVTDPLLVVVVMTIPTALLACATSVSVTGGSTCTPRRIRTPMCAFYVRRAARAWCATSRGSTTRRLCLWQATCRCCTRMVLLQLYDQQTTLLQLTFASIGRRSRWR